MTNDSASTWHDHTVFTAEISAIILDAKKLAETGAVDCLVQNLKVAQAMITLKEL